jgi:photosystem II stability/assembly factor-like uncharacterized protein
MKSKTLLIALTLVIVAFIGFNLSDPQGSKTSQTSSKSPIVNYQAPYTSPNGVVVYADSLDGANDTTSLKARGYKPYYRGTGAQGTQPTWYQGQTAVFNAFQGPTTGYMAANYAVVSGANNIDSWLVFPRLGSGGVQAGDSLYFYSRSATGSTYPDSIRVMYSINDSIPEGTWIELGRFKTNTTTGWENRGFRAPTASANGRFAIRYCVVNGGPSGANSDYIGIDYMQIIRTASLPPIPTGTWTEQTSGLTTVLYSVSAVNDDVAWVCGASGKVLRTVNKGATWTNVSGTLSTSYALYNIFAWDANTAIVTGVSGANTSIFQTSNGGATWTTADTHAGFGDDLGMTSATNGFFIGDPIAGNWDLLKSTNAGLNWSLWSTLATTNTSGTYNNAACFDGNNVWFESVGLSTIHYSANLGVNWSSQTIPLAEITAISFNSSATGLAGGSSTSPGLLKSTNYGVNWSAITNPYPSNSISGIVGAQQTWWVAQQGTGISKSTNDGSTWTTDYTAAAGSFYHMTKSRSGATIWAVRSNGGISRYGLVTGITPISNEVPATFSLNQNYPNPFNPTTKINFALPKSGLVTLKVYDVLGKEVATLVNEVKNAGTYNYEFNASSLTSGVYFYKLEANGFSDVKKMMLVK